MKRLAVDAVAAPLIAKAYEFLKSRILTNQFRPGEALSSAKISDEVGMSRSPVIEAIRLLACEGLVTIMTGQGAEVARFSERQLRELLEYRFALEVFAAGEVARIGLPGIADNLKACIHAMSVLSDCGLEPQVLASRVHALDGRFHHIIIRAVGNSYISERQENAMVLLRHQIFLDGAGEEFSPGDLQRTVDEHQEICSAIRRSDAEGARNAMSRHLGYFASAAITRFNRRERAEAAFPGERLR